MYVQVPASESLEGTARAEALNKIAQVHSRITALWLGVIRATGLGKELGRMEVSRQYRS